MNNLLYFRNQKGLSQQAVADYLGISRQAYSNYENNSREASYETLLQLAEFFDTSVDAILGRDTASKTQEVTADVIKCAIFGTDGEITDAMFEEVKDFANYVKQREAQKNDENK